MKRIIILVAILFRLPAFAQEWQRVAIDSSVSAQLPRGYLVRDTLGQKIVTATGDFGTIQILVIPDSPRKTPDIEKKKHLEEYYDNYLKSLSRAAKAAIHKERDTLLGDLHVKDFTLESVIGEGRQFRRFKILHENCNTYVFQYLFRHDDVSLEERRMFFRSIRVANQPSLASQFTTETAVAKKGKNTLIFIVPAATILTALIVILIVRRKKSKKK